MIVFKFQDAQIEAPSSWDEVTVEHFIRPEFLARDSLSLLSALTGIDRKTLMNATDNIMDKLDKMVAFYVKDPQGYAKGSTKEIFLRGKKCKVPQNIELERIGQKIMFQEAMLKHKFVYSGIPEAVAIYLVPEVNDGEFDDALVPELAEEILKMRIADVYPIADFFLSNFRDLVASGQKLQKAYLARTKNSMPTTNQLQGID